MVSTDLQSAVRVDAEVTWTRDGERGAVQVLLRLDGLHHLQDLLERVLHVLHRLLGDEEVGVDKVIDGVHVGETQIGSDVTAPSTVLLNS